jgi:hypothetical protein
MSVREFRKLFNRIMSDGARLYEEEYAEEVIAIIGDKMKDVTREKVTAICEGILMFDGMGEDDSEEALIRRIVSE